MIIVADLGGSNTDLMLADDAGQPLVVVTAPAMELGDPARFLAEAATLLRGVPVPPRLLVVTGGGHRRLPGAISGVPVVHIGEIEAIARGGLLAGDLSRALVVSMGTGTAMVAAEAGRHAHAGGVALGGGTLRGVALRLLGTADPDRIAALADTGNIRGADLTIADLVGGGVGVLPGDMPAAYLARLGEAVGDADIAASVLDMIGHVVGHLALLTARVTGHDALVVIGHMPEFTVVRRALLRFSASFGGRIIIPKQPGIAVARGALAVALAAERGEPAMVAAASAPWTPT